MLLQTVKNSVEVNVMFLELNHLNFIALLLFELNIQIYWYYKYIAKYDFCFFF